MTFSMPNILDTIIFAKKDEIALLKKSRSRFAGRSSDPRPFIKVLRQPDRLSVIAEIKKASPSKGVIRSDFDPVSIAEAYHKGGAAAMSVLTDEKFFMGSQAYLEAARNTVPLPVLRKDFIIDPIQVEQTACMNADAMLLIAACLSDSQMQELFSAAQENRLEVLLEIHSTKEMDRAFKLSPLPACLGVNNRDLATFKTDIATTLAIAPHVPKEIILVSESGIENSSQTQRLYKAGVSAILVGETLMRADDPEKMIQELVSGIV
jgi:indole-3-glycerol phosphate synthase